ATTLEPPCKQLPFKQEQSVLSLASDLLGHVLHAPGRSHKNGTRFSRKLFQNAMVENLNRCNMCDNQSSCATVKLFALISIAMKICFYLPKSRGEHKSIFLRVCGMPQATSIHRQCDH
ncbi:unnamed protein product, partial [Ectocarpus sp. 6 AP-2014]